MPSLSRVRAAAGRISTTPQALNAILAQVTEPQESLSDRELDVPRLVAKGGSNRTIAQELFLPEATVKTHLVRVHRKLGVDNRAGAVSEGARRGLVDL